jgi:hypothetical protein
MNIAEQLRKLANKLQSEALLVLASAEGSEAHEIVLDSIAASISNLESVAGVLEEVGIDSSLSAEDLEMTAAIATELDKTRDPVLKKQASALDEILRTFGAPKGAVAQAKAANEDEINRLREKYRHQKIDELYKDPKVSLDKQNNLSNVQKAVADAFPKADGKTYRPLEASLQTRYPPDMPGGHLIRISDGVYQCALTGKIYDYKNGYTTDKGNKVPGTAVEYQIPDVGSQPQGHSLFDTREAVLGRFSSEQQAKIKKTAEYDASRIGYFKAVIALPPEDGKELMQQILDTCGVEGDIDIAAFGEREEGHLITGWLEFDKDKEAQELQTGRLIETCNDTEQLRYGIIGSPIMDRVVPVGVEGEAITSYDV